MTKNRAEQFSVSDFEGINNFRKWFPSPGGWCRIFRFARQPEKISQCHLDNFIVRKLEIFLMVPPMGLGRRLAVWWSCLWRQMMFTLPLWGLGVGLAAAWLLHQRHGRYPSVASLLMAVIVVVPVCYIACLPLVGYTVRRGFIAQRLTVPDGLSFGQAAMVGLTTTGWTFVTSLPVSVAALPLHGTRYALACRVLEFVIDVAAALYVVLPRQARRLRLLSGKPGSR